MNARRDSWGISGRTARAAALCAGAAISVAGLANTATAQLVRVGPVSSTFSITANWQGGVAPPSNVPGTSPAFPSGPLTINAGCINIGSGGTLAPGSAGHGTLDVFGGVTVTGSEPALSLGFAPSPSQLFWLVLNDSGDAVTGTFNNLPEGSFVKMGTFGLGSYTAQISYLENTATGMLDGSGNDVVVCNVVPAPGAPALAGDGGLLIFRRRQC